MTTDPLRNISVVMRTRTQGAEVLEVLRRLANQSLAPCETIIVDSGSRADITEAFRRRPDTSLIEIAPESFTSAGALNRACAKARGNLIAILSQDALPAGERYLEALAAAFDDAKTAGAYGRQVPREHDHPLNVKDLQKTYGTQPRVQTDDCWFDNCCSMIRAELWRRHPFDEAMGISEDHAWGQWAIEEGFHLRYVPEAEVIHSHRRTVRWLWRRFYGEGAGLARLHGRRLTLARAVYLAARSIAGDWLWLARRRRWRHLLKPLGDRPVKYAALWMGGRREQGDQRQR